MRIFWDFVIISTIQRVEHDYSVLCLQFPCSLVDIEYDHVHAEVQCRLLSAEAGTKTRVEEDHKQGFVPAKILVGKWICLYIFCFLDRLAEVFKLCY